MTFNPHPLAHRVITPRPYVPSYRSDIRKTFDRERERLLRESFDRTVEMNRVRYDNITPLF